MKSVKKIFFLLEITCKLFTYDLNCIIEPFLESIPQIHILLTIWTLNDDIYFGEEKECIDALSAGNINAIRFVISFSTSLFSAASGISKYLRSGPCRLFPKKGFFGGFPLLIIRYGFT